MSRCFLHDIAKGRPEDHSIAGARVARKLCPRLGLSPAQTETVAWLVEHHLVMSMVAQSRDISATARRSRISPPSCRPGAAEAAADPDHRRHPRVGPGVWNGWKGQFLAHALLRDRAAADRRPQPDLARPARRRRQGRTGAARSATGTRPSATPISTRHYPPYWLARRSRPQDRPCRALIREADRAGKSLATAQSAVRCLRGRHRDHGSRARSSAPVVDDRRRLHGIGGGNIVDAQIFTTTDGRAIDTIFIAREFRRPTRRRRGGRRRSAR